MQGVGGNLQDNRHPGFLPASVMLFFLTLPEAFSDQDFLALGLPLACCPLRRSPGGSWRVSRMGKVERT